MDSKTVSGAKRIQKRSVMFPDNFSCRRHYIPFLRREQLLQKLLHIELPKKTHSLTVFLFRRGEVKFPCERAYLLFPVSAHRKQNALQNILRKRPEKITLVLLLIARDV